MSKRRTVALALKALIEAALPQATVLGFDGETARARAVPPGGMVKGEFGGPGDPIAIDLSPPFYHFEHVFTLDVFAGPASVDQAAALDAMLVAIEAAISEDQTLGGLCERVEPRDVEEDDLAPDGATSQRHATLNIVANYSSNSPLG